MATAEPHFRLFIAGEWVESGTGRTFERVNPADTRDVVGRFQAGDAADVARAVRAAELAFRPGAPPRLPSAARSSTASAR